MGRRHGAPLVGVPGCWWLLQNNVPKLCLLAHCEASKWALPILFFRAGWGWWGQENIKTRRNVCCLEPPLWFEAFLGALRTQEPGSQGAQSLCVLQGGQTATAAPRQGCASPHGHLDVPRGAPQVPQPSHRTFSWTRHAQCGRPPAEEAGGKLVPGWQEAAVTPSSMGRDAEHLAPDPAGAPGWQDTGWDMDVLVASLRKAPSCLKSPALFPYPQ